jgi:hypothetical protein
VKATNFSMTVRSPDKSVLMEVARVSLNKSKVVVTGKIMGAMPMTAIIAPDELRRLLWNTGVATVLRIVWLVLFSRKH